MAKRILLGVLQDYFGRYINGLNAENLKVAVWAGEINLESLELKKDILDSLRLPLEILCGYIHKFSVYVPWTKLGSEPVRVTIDGIYVLARACSFEEQKRNNTSSKKPIPRSVAEKRLRLKWARLLAGNPSQTEDKNANKDSFWSRLGAKILDNLQINITNVHIRYEDPITIPEKPFSIGVTFEQFTGFTCNRNGEAVFMARNNTSDAQETLYKNINFKSLAVYWDFDKTLHSNPVHEELIRTNGDFVYLLSRGIWRLAQLGSDNDGSEIPPVLRYANLHNFLLLPCSPRMLITKNERADATSAYIHARIDFDSIACAMSAVQFQMISTLQGVVDSNSVLSIYRDHRPIDTPVENPRAWWQYVFKCVKINNLAMRFKLKHTTVDSDALFKLAKSKDGTLTDWLEIVHQVLYRSKYIAQYKLSIRAELANPETPAAQLPAEIALSIQDLEDLLPLENVLAYRATAIAEIDAEERKKTFFNEANAAKSGGGMWRWLAGYETAADQSELSNAQISLTMEEKHQLMDAIDYFQATKSQNIPDGTIQSQVSATLNEFSVTLINHNYDGTLYSSSTSGSLYVETRFGNIWSADFRLHNLILTDHSIPESPYSTFVAPKDQDSDLGNLVQLTVAFQGQSEVGTVDSYSARMVTVPFKILFLPDTVNGIINFFQAGIEAHIMSLETLATIKGHTPNNVAEAPEAPVIVQDDDLSWIAELLVDKPPEKPVSKQGTGPALDVQLNIAAPVLVFPSQPRADRRAVLVVDLGHFMVERFNTAGAPAHSSINHNDIKEPPTIKLVKSVDDEFYDAAESDKDDYDTSDELDDYEAPLTPRSPNIADTKMRQYDSTLDSGEGSWIINMKKIKLALVFVDDGQRWEYVYAARKLGCNFHYIVQDFDLGLVLNDFGLTTQDFVLDMTLKNMDTIIAPMYLQSFYYLHREWTDPKWTWSKMVQNEDLALKNQVVDNFVEEHLQQRTTRLRLGLHVHHVSIKIGTDPMPNKPQKLYLVGHLYFIEAHYLDSQRITAIHLELERLELFDAYVNQETPSVFLTSGSAQSTEKLITFDATWRHNRVDETKSSSEGETLSDKLSVTAMFQFNRLHVLWNPDTITALKYLFRKILALKQLNVQEHQVRYPTTNTSNNLTTRYFSFSLQISIEAISISLIKHQSVLADIFLVNVNSKININPTSFTLEGRIGNLKLQASEKDIFTVASERDALVTFVFQSKPPENTPNLVVDISASKYYHLNLLYCELFDYYSEGILGIAFASVLDEQALTNALIAAANDNEGNTFQFTLKQFEVIIPTSIDTFDFGYLGATCKDLCLTNYGQTQQQTRVKLGGLDLFTMEDAILSEPVTFDIAFWRTPEDALMVLGNVSDINILLARGQYWLLQRVFGENILAEQVFESSETKKSLAQMSVDQYASEDLSFQRVSYQYEEEGPPLVFKVEISMGRASLELFEGMVNKDSFALFSMHGCSYLLERDSPEKCTSMLMQVKSLDLSDRRSEYSKNYFRYLFVSNAESNEVSGYAFKFFYTHSERKIQLDLFNFKSVLMMDLLFDVIGFWTSSDEDDVIPTPSENVAPLDPNENLVDWHGVFNIINPSLCLVENFEDPYSKMVVVRSNISFTWERNGNRFEKDFSYWRGTLRNVEAYIAAIPPDAPDANGKMTQDASQFQRENIFHQILEPTDLTFAFDREQVGLASKVQSRRIQLVFGQCECYLSFYDIQMLAKTIANLKWGEEDIKNVEASAPAADALLTQVSNISSRTLDSDASSEDPMSFLPPAVICDVNYIVFEIPEGFTDVGVILEQEHGFLQVSNFYETAQGASICEFYGVRRGDYLICIGHDFVCTEALNLIQDRLISGSRPILLKFLRSTSTEPVILQDAINISTKKFICNFIDDVETGDMPLANVVLASVDSFVNGSNDGNYIYGLQVNITGAHFYDLRAGSWGVLLDPCSANASCTQYNSGKLDFSVDIARQKISLNLSDTFLRMLRNTVNGINPALNDMPEKSLERASSKNYAFLLCNKTGMHLQFWNQSQDKSQAVHVADDCEDDIPFGFEHHIGTGRAFVRGFCQYYPLNISFLVPSSTTRGFEEQWEPLEGLIPNKIGSGVVRLIPKASARKAWPCGLKLKWKVEIDDKTRKLKVVLSSLIAVHNFLDYKVRVLAESTLWPSSKVLALPLEPYEIRNLPISYGDVQVIRVQPLLPDHLETHARNSFEWSGPIHSSLASTGGSSATADLECRILNGTSRFLCASVTPDPEDAVTVIFSLHPQIRLRNLLPKDLLYQERIPAISREMPIGGGVVAPGEEKQLHSLTSNPRNLRSGFVSHLTLKLDESDWTVLIPLQAPRSVGMSFGSQVQYRKLSFLSLNERVDRTSQRNLRPGYLGGIDEGSETSASNNDPDFGYFEELDPLNDLEDDVYDDKNISSTMSNASSGDLAPAAATDVIFRGFDGSQCILSMVCEPAPGDGLLVIVFAKTWILNHTGLQGLRYRGESGSDWVFPTKLNSAPPRPGSKNLSSVMMYTPANGKLRVGYEKGQATMTVDISTPGMNGHVFVPNQAANPALSLNLGIAVDVGPGLLYRTNLVTITPRFTFSNLTSCDIFLRQTVADTHDRPQSKELCVLVGETLPFWSSPLFNRESEPTFQIRFGSRDQRMCHRTSNSTSEAPTDWSEPFNANDMFLRRVPCDLKLSRKMHVESFRMEAHVGDSAGSVLIEITEFGYEINERDVLVRVESTRQLHEISAFCRIDVLQVVFLKDIVDQTVFRRGLEKARLARARKLGRLDSRKTSASMALVVDYRRSEVIAQAVIRSLVFKMDSSEEKHNVLLSCGSFDLLDRVTPDMDFRHVLRGRDKGVKFFSIRMGVKRRRNRVGNHNDFEMLQVEVMPLVLRIDEAFLVRLVTLLHTIFRIGPADSLLSDSATETVVAVLSWEDVSRVARAAKNLSGESTVPPPPVIGPNQTRFDRFAIEDIDIEVSFKQCGDKQAAAVLYGAGGGFLSRMNIRVEAARLALSAFEKSNFVGSGALIVSTVRSHYVNEASKSLFKVLTAVTDFGILERMKQKLTMTAAPIESNDFARKIYNSDEELLRSYETRLRPFKTCSNVEQLVGHVRNFVFDWRNNHRFLSCRKLIVLCVMNRSSSHIHLERVRSGGFGFSTSRFEILTPHTAAPSGSASLLKACPMGESWNKEGYSVWMSTSKMKESISLTVKCAAFRAKLTVGQEIIVEELPGNLHLSFLHKDVQYSYILYMLAVDDKIGSS